MSHAPENSRAGAAAGEGSPAAAGPGGPASGDGPPPRPWGFWATLGWTVLAQGVWFGATWGIFSAWRLVDEMLARAGAPTLLGGGLALVGGSAASGAVVLGLLAGLAALRRVPLRTYFGLKGFTGRQAVVTVGLLVAGLAGADLVLWLAGEPIVSLWDRDLLDLAGPAAMALVALVLAPFAEELWFRGFVFKGMVASRAGPVVAVLVAPLLWALMHYQYDWIRIGGIYVLGVYLTAVRWRTGSTPLAIGLHAVGNLYIMVEVLIAVHG